MLRRFLWHWLVLVFGLFLLTLIRPLGIAVDRPGDLVWAALVLMLVRTFLRPILIFFSFPLVVLTLGLFVLVINAVMLDLLPHLVRGFHVPSFAAAFFGALLLSMLSLALGGSEKRARRSERMAAVTRQTVIDI